MGIPSLRTWVVGEIVTAAELNANVRDAVNYVLGGASGRMPTFRSHHSSGQSIASATEVAAIYDTVDEDTDSAYSSSTGVFTCVTPGLYLFWMYANFSASTTGTRFVRILSSGLPANGYTQYSSLSPLTTAPQATTLMTRLAAGNTVSSHVFQASGGALNDAGYFAGAMLSA